MWVETHRVKHTGDGVFDLCEKPRLTLFLSGSQHTCLTLDCLWESPGEVWKLLMSTSHL